MENLLKVLQTALPVFATLALGMLCRKRNILSREGVGALKSIVVNITLPAVMFSAFAAAEYSARSLSIPLTVFLICCAALALGFLACKVFKIPGRLTPYLSTGFEAGMLGYALFALLYKGESSSNFAIVDLGQVLFVFTIYKAMISGKGGIRSALHEAINSPTLWAIAAGLLVGTTGLYRALIPSGVSGIVDSLTGFLAAPTSAVILLAVGYDLVPSEIRWRKTAAIVAMRVVIVALMLGVALLVNRYLLHGLIHTGALILLFILPPPYVLPVFADAQEECANISSALSVLTLIGLILFAIMSALT